jgi:hypothetical protein
VEVVLAGLALLHVLAEPLEQPAAGHQLPDAVLHAAGRHALLLPVEPQPVLLEPATAECKDQKNESVEHKFQISCKKKRGLGLAVKK